MVKIRHTAESKTKVSINPIEIQELELLPGDSFEITWNIRLISVEAPDGDPLIEIFNGDKSLGWLTPDSEFESTHTLLVETAEERYDTAVHILRRR
jgi:hypothetical protein